MFVNFEMALNATSHLIRGQVIGAVIGAALGFAAGIFMKITAPRRVAA